MNWNVGTLQEVARLTPRESDVLRLISRGFTYTQVAIRLGVAKDTVGSHVKNAYRKLGVRSGAAAVMRAVELRLFNEPQSATATSEPLDAQGSGGGARK